jgi:hypothetical protein
MWKSYHAQVSDERNIHYITYSFRKYFCVVTDKEEEEEEDVEK